MNKDGAFGRLGKGHVRFGQLDHSRYTGSVIERTIENLVALHFPMSAEMIPVRGIDDPLVFQLRIAAVDFSDDVVRFE